MPSLTSRFKLKAAYKYWHMIICSSAAASERMKINSSRSSITIGFSCTIIMSLSACLKRGGDECPLCMYPIYTLGFHNIIVLLITACLLWRGFSDYRPWDRGEG